MKKRKLSNIIKGHEDFVIQEFGERLRDFVFMSAESKVAEMLECTKGAKVDGKDEIELSWRMTWLVNDIIMIIGAYKRGREFPAPSKPNSINHDRSKRLVFP